MANIVVGMIDEATHYQRECAEDDANKKNRKKGDRGGSGSDDFTEPLNHSHVPLDCGESVILLWAGESTTYYQAQRVQPQAGGVEMVFEGVLVGGQQFDFFFPDAAIHFPQSLKAGNL